MQSSVGRLWPAACGGTPATTGRYAMPCALEFAGVKSEQHPVPNGVVAISYG